MATKARPGKKSGDERRVASRGRREPNSARAWGNRLPNYDPTLLKFACGRGIGLYTLVLRQFANVAGYCQAWVDHVLVTEPTIKAAKGNTPEEQIIADEAAARALKAWPRVRNRIIAMQKLLYGRFYGFSRAEKVARFDEVVSEWIPDLYDVPQENWSFDDDGRAFLVSAADSQGVEVDPNKFIHSQWGSADTMYGEGALSSVYLALWKIQKLETMALQRTEDNESTVIVHVPKHISGPDRAELETSYSEEYRKVILVPSEGTKVETELPTMNLTTSGAAGRQEYEAIRFYERWIQTHLLGAPQTGDKSLGTGKLEETRKGVWDDKTPLARAALCEDLTQGWMQTYCDWNLADVPLHLRPRFDSDSTDIAEGLTGIQAQEARNVALDLAAKRVTATVALELFGALGIARPRAQAMVDSIIKEREGLNALPPGAPAPAPQPPAEPEPEEQQEAA